MDSQERLSRAIDELEAGRNTQAQNILVSLVKEEPQYSDAWLALSFCFDAPERKKFCLEKVVSLQPQNTFAKQELDKLLNPPEATAIADVGTNLQGEPFPQLPVDQFAPDSDYNPAFTPESITELTEEELDASASFESFDFELPTELQSNQVGGALDPWEIPHADPTTGSRGTPPPAMIQPGISPGEPELSGTSADKSGTKATMRENQAAQKDGARYSWYEVWFMVLFTPSERTFQKIISDPNASPGRGFVWVFITSFISLFATILVYALKMQSTLPEIFALRPELAGIDPNQILGYVLIGMIVGSPLMASMSILGVILQAAFYQFIAKFMIGEGTFGEMAYALCAIFAPITLLGIIFSLPVTILNLIGALIGLYGLILTLIAIKAVNQLGWGGSCAVLIGVPILIGACSCLIFYLIFASGAGVNDLLIQLTPIP